MKNKIKILIMDKETLVHTGLKGLINAHWKDSKFLVKINADEIPDLIISGMISGNKATGVRQIKKLNRDFSSSRILIFSALDEWSYAMPYLSAGARGFLSKSADEQTIILAIETVLEGKYLYCDSQIKEQLYNHFFVDYLNGIRKPFLIKSGLVTKA